jgi:hypothetical protein
MTDEIFDALTALATSPMTDQRALQRQLIFIFEVSQHTLLQIDGEKK